MYIPPDTSSVGPPEPRVCIDIIFGLNLPVLSKGVSALLLSGDDSDLVLVKFCDFVFDLFGISQCYSPFGNGGSIMGLFSMRDGVF